MNEFELIQYYFNRQQPNTVIGIGDDAAVVNIPQGQQLVTATDTSVVGIHFPEQTPPEAIGYKALAVTLSDIAAMGAQPHWILLSLTLPSFDCQWIKHFSAGLFQLIDRHQLALIGGDTTRGPLTITTQVLGLIPNGLSMQRQGAKPSDLIAVTGTLGDAGLALLALQNKHPLPTEQLTQLLPALNYPTPQIETGLALRALATSCIDISDGLLADLQHLLKASAVGAEINSDQLPLSSTLQQYTTSNFAKKLALSAGDDYQLCFTFSPQNQIKIDDLLTTHKTAYRIIGNITEQPSLLVDGSEPSMLGYRHF